MTRVSTSRDTAARRRGPVSWFAGGFIASVRCLCLIGLIAVEALLWAVVACSAALVPLGIGLFLLPGSLQAVHNLADLFRRLAGEWAGVRIDTPYRSSENERLNWRQNNSRLLTDPATWRDLLWMTIDPLGIWVLLILPGTVIAWGLIGIVTPAIWRPITKHHGDNWYAMIHVTSSSAAWHAVPLGVVFVLIGVALGRPMLKAYFTWVRLFLA